MDVSDLPLDQLHAYRKRTYRLLPELQVTTQDEAIEFVNERGFVTFWPIKAIITPSLWNAVAGDRPVPSEHDDPGMVTWGWKDDLLDKRRWYYARVLRGKATMISLDVAPTFYALSENYGDPEQDYLDLYKDGLLSQAAKQIYEALLDVGTLDTVNLRRRIHMTGKASNSPFERGLTELQRDFKILPVGVAESGAWRYSFIYDLVHRFYPDLPEKARFISRREARKTLVGLYLDSVGAATEAETRKVFQWKRDEIEAVLESLVESGRLHAGYRVTNSAGEHFVSTDLLRTF